MCGNTKISQLKSLDNAGIDYAGFIFYDGSPRFAGDKLNENEVLDTKVSIEKIGVFVNETRDEILRKVDAYGLNAVQLHGDETPEFCKQISDHVRVIKAFRINDSQNDIDWMVREYFEVCDYYLFDKKSRAVYGGTGEKFDWSLLKKATIGKEFFLSGGISISDIPELKNFDHPFFYGVDINSHFEKSPGIKDMDLIRKFIEEMKK